LVFVQAPPLRDVDAFLRENSPIQFVAVAGDEVVGWCDVTPNQREGFRHSGVLGMGLLAGYRGRGLGRELLRETIEAALAAGLTRLELEVFATNEPAVALYEKTGFTHEGRKRAARVLDDRVEDILCMALVRPAQ
jgi:ribosomal protein S18 acetylase RimI-like enzyme